MARNKSSTLLSSPAYPFAAAGDILIPSDYHGDGKADLALFTPSNGSWLIAGSSRNMGLTFGAGVANIPISADYDGDGRTDLAYYVPASGAPTEPKSEWFILQSAGGARGFLFGVAGDAPIASVYNRTALAAAGQNLGRGQGGEGEDGDPTIPDDPTPPSTCGSAHPTSPSSNMPRPRRIPRRSSISGSIRPTSRR
jgi:hypothetical protein